jgi:hypothetical protein
MVEYLLHYLKVEGSRPCAKIFSITLPENSGGAENSTENSGPHAKIFWLYIRIESAAPGLDSRN